MPNYVYIFESFLFIFEARPPTNGVSTFNNLKPDIVVGSSAECLCIPVFYKKHFLEEHVPVVGKNIPKQIKTVAKYLDLQPTKLYQKHRSQSRNGKPTIKRSSHQRPFCALGSSFSVLESFPLPPFLCPLLKSSVIGNLQFLIHATASQIYTIFCSTFY